jgi:drug/metabolite transporter (DMT)-like permease
MPHDPLAPSPPTAEARPATGPARARLWLGLALLLVCGLAFSFHNALTRLAYDDGVTPTTVAAARTWAVALVVAILCGMRGQWPAVPRAAWLVFAATALCYSIHNPLLLFAFELIPVSLAVLVLYLYPLLVAFLAAAIGQERLKARTLVAAAVAFVGVGLVLEIGNVKLDWRGLALAVAAALSLAGNIVGAAQLNRHMRALAVPFALSLVGSVVFGAMMLADGGPALPRNVGGWWAFAGAVVTSPIAIVAFYLALPLAGAPRSALVMNAEPVMMVLIAMAILGETLGWLQIAGAALIVGAIAVATVSRLPARRSLI